MSAVTENHTEKETLAVEVNIPGHEARKTTALFERTKRALFERDGARCYVCGRSAEQSGQPLEAHHHPIERSMANMIDWERFAADAKAGKWGPHAAAFDWHAFFDGAEIVTMPAATDPTTGEHFPAVAYRRPRDPMLFVDDQTVNGLVLCRAHHTGKDEGIHAMPYPLFIAQRYGVAGYVFSSIEVIHHYETDGNHDQK